MTNFNPTPTMLGISAFSMEGRVCLITGAGQGIGAAIAHTFARAGARVLVTDRRIALAEHVAQEISALGLAAESLQLDVTDEDQWKTAMNVVHTKFFELDVLVNNAGVFTSGPIVHTTLEQIRGVMGPNVEGIYLGLKYAIPLLAQTASQRNSTTSVINLSSVGGIIGAPDFSIYCMSKGAVRMLTKAAAIELAPQRIRVNSIHPGIVLTEMGSASMLAKGDGGPAERKRQALQNYPLGRFGDVADIANAALYLGSDASAFTTGSEMVVDGGLTAR